MTLILDFKKSFLNNFGEGIFMLGFRYSKKLISLWRAYFNVQDLIIRSTINGEKTERIELLEMRLNRISAKIDQENLKLFGGGVVRG